jgi:Flp pilus assembly protein TadD
LTKSKLQNRFSRRRFLHTAAGAFAGSWALSHPFARRLGSFSGLPGLLSARPFFAFSGASGFPGQNAGPGSKWTALNQALARFDTHRFASERHFQALVPSLDELRSRLLGGKGLEDLLSSGFQGSALTSGRETVLRHDTCFSVWRTTWESDPTAGQLLDASRFSADLDRFLAPHAPLALVDLQCAALGDYDRDGFLDLYVCSYGYFQGQGPTRVPIPYYDAQNGPPNHLYRNRGDGTFVDVTTASGLDHGNNRFSFACVWADIDDDGWPDLCVVNDFGRNNLYHNRRDGTFEEITDGLPGYGAGMSATFADLGRDGLGEIYAAGMWQPVGERVSADPEFQQRFADVGIEPLRDFAMGSNLYHTTPATASSGHEEAVSPKVSPKMAAVPESAGARRAFWNWCADAFDLENDGWLDIYCLNGFLSSPTPDLAPLDAYLWEEVMALSPHTNTPSAEYRAAWAASFELAHRGHPWDGGQRNVCFLNLGAGRFADASAAVGLNFPDDSRSFAVFDYDGDADLVIHSRTGPQLRLLRNEIGHKNRSLSIRLTGTRSNRDAIGARIEVETLGGRQVRFLSCGSGFLAQHSKELTFGLGDYSQGIKVRVRWPRGGVSEFADLSAGNRYHLVEGQTNPRVEPLATADSAGARSARSQKGDLPLPARFSAVLVDPLPVPSLGEIGLFDELAAKETTAAPQAVRAHRSHRYALLWLWDAAENVVRASRPLSRERPAPAAVGAVREPPLRQDARVTAGETPAPQAEHASGLEALLAIQGQIPTRLVLWRNGSLPPGAAQQLEVPAWQANERFRLFWSTVLTHLFDYRREPPLPTGLLFEVGPDATQDPAGLASFRKLVKLYWGGADAEEILRDAHSGVPSGAAALPFLGRSLLCSFGRDFRSLGSVLPAVGFPGAGEIYLAQIVEDSPGDAEAQYNLALSRREIGKTELALSGVRAALAARPESPEAENLLGVLLSQSRQLPEAHLHLEKATQQAPDFAEAWNNLGYTLLLQGELPAAGEALQKALSLAPDFPDALDNLGIVMARQHNLARAGELFRRALELQPENEQAANNLGVLYAQQGKTQDAVATFRALLQHNPEASSAVLNLARLELSLGDDSEAKRLLGSWLARHADDAAALRKFKEEDPYIRNDDGERNKPEAPPLDLIGEGEGFDKPTILRGGGPSTHGKSSSRQEHFPCPMWLAGRESGPPS